LAYVAAGDEAPSEGRICDDLDAKFPRGLQESDGLILDVQGEGRVLDLDGGDGVDGVCPAKGGSRDFESPRYLTFPALEKMSIPLANVGRGGHSLDQLGHLGDGVFDWNRGVSAVEVVEVDVIGPQPRQRLGEGLMDVLWVGFHEPIRPSMAETELRGKEDLVALFGLLEPVQQERGRDQEEYEQDGRLRLTGHTIPRLGPSCRRRCRRCPRRFTRTRKRRPEPATKIWVSLPPA